MGLLSRGGGIIHRNPIVLDQHVGFCVRSGSFNTFAAADEYTRFPCLANFA